MADPLGRQIRFLGWRSDVETLYAASDLIVLTSDNEVCPYLSSRPPRWECRQSAQTSAACQRVVVAGETGILTDTGPSAIAAAVSQLLEDGELRARMGIAASERARRLFSTPRLVQDTADLYRSFAAGETTPGGV